MTTKTYTELSRFHTFENRFKYLKLRGRVGDSTFGFDRYMNQKFYTSREWRLLRNRVIERDGGCDLGIDGYEIHSGLYIHHMNPILVEDLANFNSDVLDPQFLITCTQQTHNAIHYGVEDYVPRQLIVRRSGDTKLW
jgi:hypothetical protein